MKSKNLLILIVSLFLFLTGCKGGKNNPVGTKETPVLESESVKSIEDIYLSLPLLGLPIKSNAQFLQKFRQYEPLDDADFHRLTDIAEWKSYAGESVVAARLPENRGKRFVIAGNFKDADHVMEIYSFLEDMSAKDHLRLYSMEELNGGKSLIIGSFEIKEDYSIEVSKRLNGTLIERLTYSPTIDGFFEELRDGTTVTVAYDSYDGINYIVETFVWDHNESGGLLKKDLKRENYLLDENGNIAVIK